MAMAGRAGKALAEAEAADEAFALFVIGEAQAHAVGVLCAAAEAMVLLQLDVAGIVSGLGELLGFLFTTGRIAKGFFGHREILS